MFASDRAYEATARAFASGKKEDHQEAQRINAEAADFYGHDSTGRKEFSSIAKKHSEQIKKGTSDES